MSGLGKLWIAAKNCITGESELVGGVFRKSKISFPAVKAEPAPQITTTRIAKSPAAKFS